MSAAHFAMIKELQARVAELERKEKERAERDQKTLKLPEKKSA